MFVKLGALFMLCLSVVPSAFSSDITWGRHAIVQISRITYRGKTYTGSLIASSMKLDKDKDIVIENPAILVDGIRGGILGQVIPLVAVKNSPLCRNQQLGRPFTNFPNKRYQAPVFGQMKVAAFVKKDEVQIYDATNYTYLVEGEFSCTSKQYDLD